MSIGSPVVLLYDAAGNPIVTNDGAAPASTAGAMVSGYDGTNSRRILVDTSGRQYVRPTDGTNLMPMGDAIARAIFQQLTDGTNGPVAVKAASTAPVATDKAMVVVLSPNQTAIPVTTSPSGSTPSLSFGEVALSASGLNAAIEKTTYTEQTANFTGSVSSSSANDTSAGTGARTIRIYFMNAAGSAIGTEDATLNGTTAVNLVTTTKCFIEKIVVLTAGSTKSNVGIISLFTGAAGGGTLVGTIAATDNTTLWAHHYVQSGKTCNVTDISHSNNSTVAGGTSTAYVRAVDPTSATNAERQLSDTLSVAGAASQISRTYGSTIQFAGPGRLRMYVQTNSASSITYRGSFDSYDL